MKHKPSLPVFALLLLAFAVDSAAQTLADVARKERYRQSRVESKTVFINAPGKKPAEVEGREQTAPSQPEPGVTTPAAQPPAPGTPGKPSGTTDKLGRDETFWRGEFAKARAELTRAEQRASLAQLKINDLNSQLLMNSAMFNRENRLGPELTESKKQLETAQAEVAAAKQKIVNLEEELRRSGGPPGWAR